MKDNTQGLWEVHTRLPWLTSGFGAQKVLFSLTGIPFLGGPKKLQHIHQGARGMTGAHRTLKLPHFMRQWAESSSQTAVFKQKHQINAANEHAECHRQ